MTIPLRHPHFVPPPRKPVSYTQVFGYDDAAHKAPFSKLGYTTLANMAEALLPDAPHAPKVSGTQIADLLSEYFSNVPVHFRLALSRALEGFNFVTLAWPGYGKPFNMLTPEQRRAIVADMNDSGFILKFAFIKAIRGVVNMAYYGLPEVLDAVGYKPGEHVDRIRKVHGQWEDWNTGAPSTMIPHVEKAGPAFTYLDGQPNTLMTPEVVPDTAHHKVPGAHGAAAIRRTTGDSDLSQAA
jgi:hypothetical protein